MKKGNKVKNQGYTFEKSSIIIIIVERFCLSYFYINAYAQTIHCSRSGFTKQCSEETDLKSTTFHFIGFVLLTYSQGQKCILETLKIAIDVLKNAPASALDPLGASGWPQTPCPAVLLYSPRPQSTPLTSGVVTLQSLTVSCKEETTTQY